MTVIVQDVPITTMETRVFYQCDGPNCKSKIEKAPMSWHGAVVDPAADWLFTGRGPKDAGSLHFCTPACISAWALAQTPPA